MEIEAYFFFPVQKGGYNTAEGPPPGVARVNVLRGGPSPPLATRELRQEGRGGGRLPRLPFTQPATKDNSTLSPMSRQIRPALASQHSPMSPATRWRSSHGATASVSPSRPAARWPPSQPGLSRPHTDPPASSHAHLTSDHPSTCSQTPSESLPCCLAS